MRGARALTGALLVLCCALAVRADTSSFSVPGRPFGIAVGPDGATLYVSNSGGRGARGGVRVFHRTAAGVASGQFVPLDGIAYGEALTRDGATLLVANDAGVAALDAQALARDTTPRVAYVSDGDAGAIEVVASRDGAYAFASEERRGMILVVHLTRKADGSLDLSIAGRVPVGRAPVGLALSADGARLYVTSETAQRNTTFANGNDPAATCGQNGRDSGTLSVIDVAKAASGGRLGAVVDTFAAGCAPVRVALAPDGDVAWVTARGDDRVLAFDVAKIGNDPAHALSATVRVGKSPVGIAALSGGKLIAVANSDRFSPSSASTMDVLSTADILARKPALRASHATGSFPRELAESPDGTTLYLTNFRSDTVQMFNVRDLDQPAP